MTPDSPELPVEKSSAERLNEWVSNYEAAWRSGTTPLVEKYLHGVPDRLRSEVLTELIAVDLEFRWRGISTGKFASVHPDGSPVTADQTLVGPRLVDYQILWSETLTSEQLRELLVEEFRVRWRFGDRPGLAEFAAQDLPGLLPGDRGLLPKLLGELEPQFQAAGIPLSDPSAAVWSDRAEPIGEPLQAGADLGRYVLRRELGAGAMGSVFLAFDKTLEREVALKFPKRTSSDDASLRRFLTEARAAARLRHPNLCPVYDVGLLAGRHFIAMAFIPGLSLADWLAQAEPPDESRLLRFVEQIAEGLRAAHREGIIHRDLKPANIMLDAQLQPVVMDFGLARQLSATESRLTQQGSLLGTPAYMSPEQVECRLADIGPASDIFSLGVILYQLLTGRLPFDGPLFQILQEIVSKDPLRPSQWDSKIPPRLDEICLRMLAKRLEDRFSSMTDVLDAIAEFRRDRLAAPTQWPLTGQSESLRSIAVLPFENSTDDPELEFLCDGITESLISGLSRIHNLKVMARSTVFRFKGQSSSAQEFGRELQVDAVVTGNLRLRNSKLRIATELLNVRDGALIWGAQFHRDLADLLELEEEISKQLAKSLKLKLTQRQRQRLARRPTANVEAYQLYLKGRFHWNRRNATDLQKAIEHFRAAIEIDPNYALAYAGLADSYGLQIAWGAKRPADVCPLARAMAERALALDDSLGEAYTSLGYVQVVYDWNWAQAEQDYRRALQLNPNYATTHHWLGYLLMCGRRFREARDSMAKALSLDPLAVMIAGNLGYCLYFQGRYEDALRQVNLAIEMDNRVPPLHYYRGLILEQMGALDSAIGAFEQSVQASGGVPGDLGGWGHALAAAGRTAEAQSVLERLQAQSATGFVTHYNQALIEGALGQRENAFRQLEQAIELRDFYLIYTLVDPRLARFQTDSKRFDQLLQRTGLKIPV